MKYDEILKEMQKADKRLLVQILNKVANGELRKDEAKQLLIEAGLCNKPEVFSGVCVSSDIASEYAKIEIKGDA